jgi:hypothetical protein
MCVTSIAMPARHGQVMRRHRRGAEALAIAHDKCRHHGRHTGVDVHHRTAGEIQQAQVAEPAAAPHPVAHRQVDQREPEGREPQHGGELHALGKTADHQRRGDDGEGHLEHDKHGFRDRAAQAVAADP